MSVFAKLIHSAIVDKKDPTGRSEKMFNELQKYTTPQYWESTQWIDNGKTDQDKNSHTNQTSQRVITTRSNATG